MLEIGTKKDVKKYGHDHILISEIIEKERHNHVYFFSGEVLDSGTQNDIARIAVIPFKRWRIIGCGLVCVEATTDGEDPVVHFGTRADPDCVAIMTPDCGAGENIALDEYTSYDQYGILPDDDITDDVDITWSEAGSGSIWDTWQTTIEAIQAKAITGSITTGQWIPFIVVEVDADGEF